MSAGRPPAASPDGGYGAARAGAALIALPERALLAVSGAMRQKFVHGLVSNDVLGRAAGEGCLASLMDVKGHLLAFFRVLACDHALRLELPAARLEALRALFEHYRVAAPVKFAPEPEIVMALVGPAAGDVLARAGVLTPPEGRERHVETVLAGRAVRVVRAGDLPGAGFVLHVDREAAADGEQALFDAGACRLERAALDALRVEHGRPWYGFDVGEDNLLHETGLVAELHSASKGCYVGQEVIARLEARGGNVSRALRGLRLERPAERGAALLAGDDTVGEVTTAAVSPRLGPIAMAYVHRKHFEPGTLLQVAGAPATVTALPFPAQP